MILSKSDLSQLVNDLVGEAGDAVELWFSNCRDVTDAMVEDCISDMRKRFKAIVNDLDTTAPVRRAMEEE